MWNVGGSQNTTEMPLNSTVCLPIVLMLEAHTKAIRGWKLAPDPFLAVEWVVAGPTCRVLWVALGQH